MHTVRYWENVMSLSTRNYTCGYADCGREVGSEKGWVHLDNPGHNHDGFIYICPACKRPTFFDRGAPNAQMPGVSLGTAVRELPKDIKAIWSEIRTSTSHGAYTSAVLAGRKLLMHIAVAQGAEAGLSFVQYVDYLVDKHYAPPNSKPWIDKIRSHGNEANHEIVVKGVADAEEIMTFLEMLMRFIYEFPAKANPQPKPA